MQKGIEDIEKHLKTIRNAVNSSMAPENWDTSQTFIEGGIDAKHRYGPSFLRILRKDSVSESENRFENRLIIKRKKAYRRDNNNATMKRFYF